MKLIWEIEESDARRISDFVNEQNNSLVNTRIARNINREGIKIDKNIILRTLIMCLLTSQQRSGPDSPIGIFLQKHPDAFTVESLINVKDKKTFVISTLVENELKRYVNRISDFFITNFEWLQKDDWQTMDQMISKLIHSTTKELEREVADTLAEKLKGIGPKQSRNFLQALGLTKYEIPIDSRITDWLNKFGFPVTLTSAPLQDLGYYHFVSDGIQELCLKAGIYPCVLDAAIFSSYDNDGWMEKNVIHKKSLL